MSKSRRKKKPSPSITKIVQNLKMKELGAEYRAKKKAAESSPSEPSSALPVPVSSLPLAPAPDSAQTAPPTRKKRITALPGDSEVRVKAAQITAMRILGYTTDEIAAEVGLSPRTVKQYMYLAGKNGWLDPADPVDALEYKLSHKVVRNLDEMLDARNEKVTIKTAQGVLFPRIAQQAVQAPQMTLNVKIEHVGEGVKDAPDVASGTPAYVDGEVAEVNED